MYRGQRADEVVAVLRSDVRLEWFVSFLAVVDTGSFGAAAEATHRSQPRVSMHVAALEREAGVALFDRRKRPVALTDAGAALAEHARRIVFATALTGGVSLRRPMTVIPALHRQQFQPPRLHSVQHSWRKSFVDARTHFTASTLSSE
ncbi:LysR family transcriptional regulator [Streptomyces sp. NPDC049687]|uniref:LysR family transcriptional regulator n=1 Tax=Streptomyces sp. NPDC049687 TaxID=3365596 RepID=UPI003788FCFD